MWNGECHLLAASSAAERNLWLESINACANGDSLNEDATSTDSSSSSDSSPTSNLSAKSLDIGQSSPLIPRRNYGSSIMAALRNREAAKVDQHEPMLDLVVRHDASEPGVQTEVVTNESHIKYSQQPHVDYQSRQSSQMQEVNSSNKLVSQHRQESTRADKSQLVEQDKQAYKRRLMSIQMSNQSAVGDPKLITCAAFGNRPCQTSATCRLSETSKKGDIDVGQKTGRADATVRDDNEGDKEDQEEEEDEEEEVEEEGGDDDDDDEEEEEYEEDENQTAADGAEDENCEKQQDGAIDVDDHVGHGEEEQEEAPTRRANGENANDVNVQDALAREKEREEEEQVTPTGGERMIAKQKKRVTFDLSSLASESCYASSRASRYLSSESSSLSDSSEEELETSSSSSSSSSSLSDEELEREETVENDEDEGEDEEEQEEEREGETRPKAQERDGRVEDGQSANMTASLELDELEDDETANHHLLDTDDSRLESIVEPEVEPMCLKVASGQQRYLASQLDELDGPKVHASEQQQLLLAARLDEAQTSIGQLERRLNSSYASYSQLEISYKRLQVDLAASREQHKLELAQVQARVDELTRELAASERRLAEMRDKLFSHELKDESEVAVEAQQQQQQQDRQPQATQQKQQHLHRSLLHNNNQTSQKVLLNSWLRANTGQVNHHQPLMLIQHVKQHSVNQQTLSLKLLNQSKQIQRKLNELELKVDQIQSCAAGGTLLSSRCLELDQENSMSTS